MTSQVFNTLLHPVVDLRGNIPNSSHSVTRAGSEPPISEHRRRSLTRKVRGFTVSPFAARAAARNAARWAAKAKTTSPRSAGKKMRSITDSTWSTKSFTGNRFQKQPGLVSSSPSSVTRSDYSKATSNMTMQEKIAAQNGRTKLCKHFLLGCCPHGDTCTYTHDIAVMKPDEQKVFIGGIPSDCSSRQLIEAIEKVGFKVLNIPKCHPAGFAPKVCLESVEKAKALLKIARIDVGGATADVRKFTDSRSHNRDNMCVKVSGLPEGTTGQTLMEALENAEFLIERSPLIQAGETTCERLEMATVEQADALLTLEEYTLLGVTVKFTPYAMMSAAPKPRSRREPSPSHFGWTQSQGREVKRTGFLNRAVRSASRSPSVNYGDLEL